MTEARMQETPDYKPGTFCWVELGTSDSAAAKKFYTALFDWDHVDHPMGPGMVYTMLQINGKDIGGLYQLIPEMVTNGVPPHWMSYVSVTNADETAAKVKEAGGTLMKEPFDVTSVGRMAVVQDPTGGVFALWQPGTHQGAGIANVPNTPCWNELATRDPRKAGEFYSKIFGWALEPMGDDYTIFKFKDGDRGAGGMFTLPPELAHVPPHWMVYFAVDDCDAKVQKATELGASLIKAPENIPGVGRFAILLDPQGAGFALIQLEPQN